MPNIDEMNLMVAKEEQEKDQAQADVENHLDPFSQLDFRFTMAETQLFNMTKRQKMIDHYNTLAKAQYDSLQELRDRADKAIKNRDEILINYVSDKGNDTGWYEFHKKAKIPFKSGYYYMNYSKSRIYGWRRPPEWWGDRVKYLGQFKIIKFYRYDGTPFYEEQRVWRISFKNYIALEGKKWCKEAQELGDSSYFKSFYHGNKIYPALKRRAGFAYLHRQCFPSIKEYEGSEDSYPYFVDYLENLENGWPDGETADVAVRKWLGFGTTSYGNKMIERLTEIAQANINPNNRSKWYVIQAFDDYADPEGGRSQTTLGVPTINPHYVPWIRAKYYYNYRKTNMTLSDYDAKRLADNLHKYTIGELDHPKDVFKDAPDLKDKVSYSTYLSKMDVEQWPREAKMWKAFNMQVLWWWPRPKPNYLYIPKIGYVNPLYFNMHEVYEDKPNWLQLMFESMQNNLQRNLKKLKRFMATIKNPWDMGAFIFSGGKYSSFGRFFVNYMGDIAAHALRAVNPVWRLNQFMRNTWLLKDVYRELNYFTGGLLDKVERISELPSRALLGEPIKQEDWNLVIEAAITAVSIYATGGAASAYVGAASGQLRQGPLGRTDLGRTLLTFGEVYAVSSIAKSSVSTALKKQAEKEVMQLAIKEAGEATGLDETIAGRLALHVGAQTAYKNLYQDEEFMAALEGSATGEGYKQIKLEVAKQNPYAAMALAITNEIEKHGWEGITKMMPDFSDPTSIFDSIDWSNLGGEAKKFIQSIDKKDIKKYTGLLIGVATGKINEDDALLYVGQDIAIKNIDRFYAYEERATQMSEEELKMAQIQQEVDKTKKELEIWGKIRRGNYIPTRAEFDFITGDGAVTDYIFNVIEAAVPSEAVSDAFAALGDIGIPRFEFPEFMKIQSVDMPEWMKVGSFESPEWAHELEQKMREKIDKKISETDWFNALRNYLMAMMPGNVPYKQIGSGDIYDYRFLDELKDLKIRAQQDFYWEHPMLQTGILKRKWTAEEIAYRSQRIKEINDTIEKLKEAEIQAPPEMQLDFGLQIEQLEQLV